MIFKIAVILILTLYFKEFKNLSRRPDAKTVKISEASLNILKHVKEEVLNENSYSTSIFLMGQDFEARKKEGTLSKINFIESDDSVLKDKTIVLSSESHVLLNNIKYDLNFKTISDAIEYLCKQWQALK